ncbi:dihydrolipoamide acetyltransferase family protein [Sinorhizobium americanum]|uniref:Dihydrolipoamide acetyltransferase component of pyruvate dehydrogenase complex n=1 Tax=Sinorhizobium americanum TaxID=194963 RepID=A0A1L3LZ16_9HYPH|nr:dihydrolipoamide acetyltransferase family protein [Sinorhizobium americanum]APG95318.1 dihydrolipoyllysine-residue acetyltransferase component of pyruvate dehydrogenase complex [Sinorhizobium americanum]OAP46912.1 branched-chain alpha-keto acid dehydrogenase subunit E2 [Sinorhizobium americanum]
MATEVILPKVDMDMATGKISKWFFGEGDAVKEGDVLFEIETDKAAMEIDAPASGVLRNVTGKEGVDIPVGSAVAWIYAEGETVNETAVPLAPPATAESPLPVSEAKTPAAEVTVEQKVDSAPRATPLARRLARERELDLARLNGSGPRGRIVSADVLGASNMLVDARAQADPAAVQSEAPGSTAGENALRHFPDGSYELQAHSSMRRTIARRLVEAKSSVPHFYLKADCRLDALLKLRAELNAAAPLVENVPAYKLSVNDLVIKAYALALAGAPDANVSWMDEHLVRHSHSDVGVAVSVPGGLITPIIRQAEQKSLSTISNEMKDLAARAKAGKLKPNEYQGGTGAVSNLGMYGVKEFAAIINPPHSTILAVGAGEKRPVVTAEGELGVATVMSVTLSTDHRAVDGALGAELLAKFRALIENPLSMLV